MTKTDYKKMYRRGIKLNKEEYMRAEYFLDQMHLMLNFCKENMDMATYNRLRGTMGLSIEVEEAEIIKKE